MNQLGCLDIGPRAGDALPLLQLAGLDGQPVTRLVAGWLGGGAMAGVALAHMKPVKRSVLALAFAASSNASFALARDLRLASVLMPPQPGAGVRIEDLPFAIGCALPAIRDLALGRPEHRDARDQQPDHA